MIKKSFTAKILAIITMTPVFASNIQAANVALGKLYSYSIAPRFTNTAGGNFNTYTDKSRGHASYTTAGAFDTGELTDNFIQTTDSPVSNIGPTAGDAVVGFGTTTGGTPTFISDITIDLAGSFLISEVTIGSYVFTPNANGAPSSLQVAFSTDGSIFTPFTTSNFTGSTTTGHYLLNTGATSANAGFVRVRINGANRQNGNKVTIDEIRVEGVAIPEPSSTSLLGLAGLALIIRRRR
ncbi:hypothetical protein NT6N_15940 [Oceaniferula spumae]|uniref:Ice-binding protein C-terminal domain-containing protein n=1 Tax=Oceaniferula spumae TaxID=2979115 RepID=A0AAT9FKQ3_9BACT